MNAGCRLMNKAIDFSTGTGELSALHHAARNYVQNGICIVELPEREKGPKRKGWLENPVRTIEQVDRLWGRNPNLNIGIPCAPNAFVCIDIDLRKDKDPADMLDGFQELEILEQYYGFKCESSVTQKSGSGGKHFFFKAPEGVEYAGDIINPLTGEKCKKIDIRYKHQIVAEPSIHPNGGQYQFIGEGPIFVEPSEIPDQLLALIRKDRQRQTTGQPNKVSVQRFDDFADEYNKSLLEIRFHPEGGRNNNLQKKAVHIFSLVKEGKTKATIEQAKADMFEAAISSGLEPDETEKTLESALNSLVVATASPEKAAQAKADYLKQKALSRGINWSDLTDSGRPKDTIENLEALLKFYGIVCRNNVIKKEPEILIPNKQFFADTQANDTLAEIISISKRENFSTAHTDQYLNSICNKNRYNPVLTWVDSKKWDGKTRLGNFLKTVKVQEPKFLSTGEPFHEHLIRKWMIQAMTSATSVAGISSIGVLVFSGEGGIGKTSWFRNLVPEGLRESLIKTESSVDPHNKDDVLENIKYWIVELGELDGTFKKSEIAALKGFITRPRDEVRPPYGRKSDIHGRRTVFCASVNSDSFLVDETGNRRFWTVPTVKIDYEHGFDMQQVWAEVMHLIRSGETFLLNQEATNLLHETNNEHMMADPIVDKLETVFDWNAHKSQWIRKNRNEIFYMMMCRDPNRLEANRLTQLLKNKGLVCKKSNGARFYEIPPVKNDMSFL